MGRLTVLVEGLRRELVEAGEPLAFRHHSQPKGKEQVLLYVGKAEAGEIAIVPREDGEYEVSNVLVWPKFQRHGYGTSLYLRAAQLAHGKGKRLFVSNDLTSDAKAIHIKLKARGLLKASGEVVPHAVESRELAEEAAGQCFSFAVQLARQHLMDDDLLVVHGTIAMQQAVKKAGKWVTVEKRIPHAWVEWKGKVFDWQTQSQAPNGTPQATYYRAFKAKPKHKYPGPKTLGMAVRHGHYGPWESRERLGEDSQGEDPQAFAADFYRRHAHLAHFKPKVVAKASGASSGHPEARQHGGEVWLFPKFWALDPKTRDWVFAHELGHYVQSERASGTKFLDLADGLGIDPWDTANLPYGQFNQDEAFADCFAAYHLDRAELHRRYPAWERLVQKIAG